MMKLSQLFLLSVFGRVVFSVPMRRPTSPYDISTSREDTPGEEIIEDISHAEQMAQAATNSLGDNRGQYRFRSITTTRQLLLAITLDRSRPSARETGITVSDTVGTNGHRAYVLWIGRDDVTTRKVAAHGIHRFELGPGGKDERDIDALFAHGSEQYAVRTAVQKLAPRHYYLTPSGFNNIMAHLEAILEDSHVDSDQLSSIMTWRLNFDNLAVVARGLEDLTQAPKAVSPRQVYDLIAYGEVQASAFSAERLARRALPRRNVINEINADESKAPASNHTTRDDIEVLIEYFYALQANATAALMPFIDTLISSNNFYLESLALPLYGMVCSTALIDSPFAPGPLGATGFDAFDDIQSDLQKSGNYSKSQLAYTNATHQFMRDAFHSIWNNATAVVNATGSLLEMKNIMLFLAVTDMQNPNATDLFPKSYKTVQTDADISNILDRTNFTSARSA